MVLVTLVVQVPLVTVYVITTLPTDTPVTTPEELIVAIAVLPLLQTPPVVVFERVVVDPTVVPEAPAIAATVGFAFTVTDAVVLFVQPLPFAAVIYVIDTTPAVIPVTRPALLTVATAVLLLLQLPPVVAFESCEDPPSQTVKVPVIAATVGFAFTVTVEVELLVQPLPFAAVV